MQLETLEYPGNNQGHMLQAAKQLDPGYKSFCIVEWNLSCRRHCLSLEGRLS